LNTSKVELKKSASKVELKIWDEKMGRIHDKLLIFLDILIFYSLWLDSKMC